MPSIFENSPADRLRTQLSADNIVQLGASPASTNAILAGQESLRKDLAAGNDAYLSGTQADLVDQQGRGVSLDNQFKGRTLDPRVAASNAHSGADTIVERNREQEAAGASPYAYGTGDAEGHIRLNTAQSGDLQSGVTRNASQVVANDPESVTRTAKSITAGLEAGSRGAAEQTAKTGNIKADTKHTEAVTTGADTANKGAALAEQDLEDTFANFKDSDLGKQWRKSGGTFGDFRAAAQNNPEVFSAATGSPADPGFQEVRNRNINQALFLASKSQEDKPTYSTTPGNAPKLLRNAADSGLFKGGKENSFNPSSSGMLGGSEAVSNILSSLHPDTIKSLPAEARTAGHSGWFGYWTDAKGHNMVTAIQDSDRRFKADSVSAGLGAAALPLTKQAATAAQNNIVKIFPDSYVGAADGSVTKVAGGYPSELIEGLVSAAGPVAKWKATNGPDSPVPASVWAEYNSKVGTAYASAGVPAPKAGSPEFAALNARMGAVSRVLTDAVTSVPSQRLTRVGATRQVMSGQ